MSNTADELFQSFLKASPDEAEQLLSTLMSEHASPLIRQIVSYRVKGAPVDDLQNDVLLALLARVRHSRESPGDRSIHNFRDYVAVLSYNACSRYFRQRDAGREALRRRLRYILRHDRDFALWLGINHWLCGSAHLRGRTDSCSIKVSSD